MDFVKTQIYRHKITEKGIEETEEEARSKQELEKIERLNGLPEFQKDEHFLSLSEQLERNKKEKEKKTDADNDIGDIDESILADLPYLNEQEYINSCLHYSEDANYIIEKKKELENVKKEYEEAKNNILKKKKIQIENEKKEEDFLLKEIENLKKVKKIVNKEKKIKKNLKFPIQNIIKVKPNKKEPKNNSNTKSSKLEKKSNDVNENNKNTLASLLSGYSDESD